MVRLSKTIQTFCVLWVLMLCAVAYQIVNRKHTEGFLNPYAYPLQPGKYPISVDKPLLHGVYKVKKNPGVSDNEAANIYKNYPVFPASCSYNNNIRYWKKPTNGTCSPAEFCGNLYKDTIHPIPAPPPQPEWDNGIRVNYYESSKYCE